MSNNEMMPDEGFGGIGGAANFLNVNTSFVRRRCSDKWQGVRIPSYRIAGKLMFLRKDLVDWANFHKNEGKDAK
jgi:hypothetical protein